MSEWAPLQQALISGNEEELCRLVRQALDQGTSAKDILNQALTPAMDVVGERMENEDMFIPEVLMAAKAMSAAVEILKPFLTADELNAAGKVVIGTVKGDLHDIGKNLVAMMMESAGFEVKDLGVDVAPEAFVAAARDNGAQLVCLSALLTTTMPMMQETIAALEAEGLRHKVKVMVGGAPVTQDFAASIHADGYAPDAGSAAKLAKTLVQ
ncbi:5-methyltetrahydrofolate--homocysteine methyltransferase [Desulfacinum hydrothermale DSM 13146]|uniref:5-methyltetrahydrofolate--homocysteine methyltransferase n=1 Tax=Desulfacinum hydrothermale DSM 13146 TaxID=1121390 RepID=A0A1W1XGD9_9BACT|nr:corrinoid protein [Desulfacinum hydrothermale]SMC23055.1 5-methyltetrahydrofolate--homocysteine methyltransferase [Desulfacinum hydrothermale DSM 13146]